MAVQPDSKVIASRNDIEKPQSGRHMEHIDKKYNVHSRRFCEESHRVFVQDSDSSSVECLQVFPSSDQVSQKFVSEKKSLFTVVKDAEDASKTAYIARQRNTFSRLLVTQDAMQLILDSHHVFDEFFDALNAFGFKRDDDHKVWDGYHRVNTQSEPHLKFEFCFVVRYVEKHNRNPKKPWSLRQVGFYHQLIPQHQKSIWILLQPSEKTYNVLRQKLENHKLGEGSVENSCLFYLDSITLLAENWSEYIDYLWADVSELDDKACHSAVGFRKRNDYIVDFADCQKLQRLRRHLLRTLSVLESCLALANGMSAHFKDLKKNNIIRGHDFERRIEIYQHQIRSHRRSMITMLNHIQGTADLLVNLLSSRNDKTILDTNQAMKSSLELMERIAQQNQDDSRLLKTLSLIATIYLPASLIATIFSSNLIQLQQGDHGSTYFQPTSQFWIYIVLTISLTIITLIDIYVALKPRNYIRGKELQSLEEVIVEKH